MRQRTWRTARRWGAAAAVTVLALFGLRSEARETESAKRAERRALIERVDRWGCQYQNIDVGAIAASALDLVVIEPTIDGAAIRDASREEITRLQTKPGGGRRLVLAYLSIGAAEEYRRYWHKEWREAPPPWLGAADPDWPRSHAVRYWHADWQRLVSDRMLELVEAGYDGVFLDRVDAYAWHRDRPTAQQEMIAFVGRLADVARARRPNFLLIGQNAEPLLTVPVYRDTIDAVSKESLLTGLRGPGHENTADEIAWSLGYLRPAQAAGLPILAIEYPGERSTSEALAARLRGLRFKPFLAARLLDRLP